MEEQVWTRRNPKPKAHRPSTVTIPANVTPVVRIVFEEMRRQNKIYDVVSEGSGVLRATIKAWRYRNVPTLTSVEAVLGYLGWDFVPVPRAKVLPPGLVEALRPVADRFSLDMPTTVQALVEIVAGIHSRFDEQPSALVTEPT